MAVIPFSLEHDAFIKTALLFSTLEVPELYARTTEKTSEWSPIYLKMDEQIDRLRTDMSDY